MSPGSEGPAAEGGKSGIPGSEGPAAEGGKSGIADKTPTRKRGAGIALPDLEIIPETGGELDPDARLITQGPGLAGALRAFGRRLRQGELGNLPVLLGIVVIWSAFQILNNRFLSAGNLTNLSLQIAATGTISVGIVLVLLLGEIDLSVGSVSGFTAAIMAVLNVKNGWSGPAAVFGALAVGALIGAFHGAWFSKLRVPSFVVTLAGLLAWQGALLYTLGSTGTINLSDDFVVGLTSTFFGKGITWAVAVGIVVVYVAALAFDRQRRARAGIPVTSLQSTGIRVIALAVIVGAAAGVFAQDRGLPLAAVILVGFVVVFDLLLRRTRWGRHLFAVGGNAEAARRAGINVDGIRIAVFALASTMAAVGGVLGASRLLAVNQSSGGSDLLLNSIAAAVIGGTSLFGGRGSAWSALLGAVVIGSISNGMDLLAVQSSVKFMVTGAVLLTAVTIDALSRRGRTSAGRA